MITADAKSKVYGAADPLLTASYSGFKNSDTAGTVLSGALSRTAGENVGNYAISQNTLASNTNYTISYTGNNLGITPAALAINAVTDSRVYNGTTNSTGTVTYTGLQGGDTLSGLTQAYASKNVLGVNGSILNVNDGYTLDDGNAGGNYTVTKNTAAGTITPLAITGNITVANKVYDANNSATILTRTLSGVIGPDTVIYTGGTALFSDKNVANAKTVTGTGLGLSGADADNYTVNTTAITTANITPAPGIPDNYTAVRTPIDAVTGDTVIYTGGTARFSDKNVANAKTATGNGLSLSGIDTDNYTVNSPEATKANIPPATPDIAENSTSTVPTVAPVVVAPVEVAPVEVAPVEVAPVVAAPEKPAKIFVSPKRPRKQDRN
jgi:hypothetical protein